MKHLKDFIEAQENPIFILVMGLSGSGKTTLANKLSQTYQMEVISFEEIRKELERGEIFDIGYNEIVDFVGQRIRKKLEKGESVILDSVGLNSQRRAYFLKKLKDVDCATVCVMKLTDIKTCINNQQDKLFETAEDIIWKQYEQFQVVNPVEGWNYIARDVYNAGPPLEDLYKQGEESEYTPVLQHLEVVSQMAIERGFPPHLLAAAKYHDIGKFSLRFVGESENPEYLHHENIGAYLYALTADDVNWIYVSNLILWHEVGYEMSSEKRKKIQKRFGQRFTNDLILLSAVNKEASGEI